MSKPITDSDRIEKLAELMRLDYRRDLNAWVFSLPVPIEVASASASQPSGDDVRAAIDAIRHTW